MTKPISPNLSEPSILPVKLLNDSAKMPFRAHDDDAGLDIHALNSFEIAAGQGAVCETGVAIALPERHVGLITDRSSMAKRGLKTAGGIIDAGYRGEIRVILWNMSGTIQKIEAGDRIAQLLVIPISLTKAIQVTDLNETARGAKGFGSSGK